jgi:hypothetical protein
MKYSDIYESITAQFGTTHTGHKTPAYLLLGKPGGGKSDLARAIGRDLKFDKVVEFNASLRDPVDLLGTPNNQGETTRWKKPDDLAQLEHGRNLLIIEELTDCTQQMQNACCGLIYDGKVGELDLSSSQTYIIASGNRTEDKSGAFRLSTKLGNRMRILDFDVSLDDWCEWAIDNLPEETGYKVVQFLRFKPDLLDAFDPNARISPTPRAWARASLVPTNLRSDLYFANVAGDVGEGAAAPFTAFCRLFDSMPNPDEIMMNPSKAEVPTKMDVLYALTGAIAHRINKDNFDRAIEFIDRLPPEFNVMCVQDAMKMKPEIKHTKAFVSWAVKNSSVVI